MGSGARQATILGPAKSQTRLMHLESKYFEVEILILFGMKHVLRA